MKDLETASSYLLILQNLEPPAVAQNHATLLLDAALDTSYWELAKDLVRFLRTIGSSHNSSLNMTCMDLQRFLSRYIKTCSCDSRIFGCGLWHNWICGIHINFGREILKNPLKEFQSKPVTSLKKFVDFQIVVQLISVLICLRIRCTLLGVPPCVRFCQQ